MKKTDLDAIRADLIAALDTVAATHGLTMSLGGLTYDDDGFRVKITAHRGSAEDAERAEFEGFQLSSARNRLGKTPSRIKTTWISPNVVT